ncbi:MAG TPA: hypothetical protein VJZ71_20300 [Phycisphaerae bacterium]|nr:hypothetical protein [Phycisphaerae bacterium]
MDLRRSVIAGPGTLRVETGATLRVLAGDASTFEPATIRTNVVGTGEILVGAGQELLVEGGAVVDMGGASGGGCADPAQASNWGRIEVNGQLVVRDSTIRNTNVDVLSGDLSDLTEVHNNQINLLQNPPGWGGEFYVEGTSTIECNVIYSEGDRYLDLDPDPLASPRPTINENKFNVSILQGTSIPQGELLELRSVDYDNGLGGELSGAYELAASSAPSPGGYTDTWVLEQLEIRPNAKVNLTNRQGFVFQDPQITIPEAIYVKEIKLHPGAVLNTGHQRLYYQTLVDETGAPLARDPQDPSAPMSNGSRIIDVPLLGFSLKVIAMEDQTEFDVRVQKRLRDPADLQPPFPPFKEGAITREVGLDPQNPANGVMKIKTKASGSLQASSAAAHGAFARAGEAEILVQFRYRFCGQTTDELIVYLTDSPEVSQNLVEVARVRPPASGPGSIDSGTYATFSGNFPRGNLNFLRGTYVELELRGPDACVLIDDWDPVVCPYCGQCGDLNQDCGVTDLDYLYLLSEFGQPVRNANLCADVLSSDNYIDMSDLLALAGALSSYPVPLNLCGNGSGGGGTVCGEELPATCEDPPSESLLIAGKPGGAGLRDALAHNDTLYGVNAQTYAAGPGVPAPAQSGGLRRGHGRLMTDSLGRLHQVHGILGLIRLTDGVAVVKPAPKSYLGDTVRIGRTTGGGYPLADAAFDPNDPDMVYVAPVHITPAGGGLPYRAVAKLRLSGNGNFELVRTYGANPADTPEIECINCTEIVYQNDASRIREIEVDSYGNLFVASALEVNDYNYLLIYPADGGSEIRVPLTGQVQAPSALHVSGDKLYVSTSLDALDHASAVIHRYNIIRAGRNATLLEHDTDIPVVGIRHLTAMTTNPADGTLWAVGFYSSACSTAQCAADPDCSGGCDFPYQESDSIFTTPKVVIIANPATTPVVQEVATLGGSDLALPLSVIFQDVPCGTGDFDGGGLGESDIVPFVNALLSPTPADLCPGDMNHDSIFDGRDIQIFIASLTP